MGWSERCTQTTVNAILAISMIFMSGLSACQAGIFPNPTEPTGPVLGEGEEPVTFAASRFSQNVYEQVVKEFNSLQIGFSVQYVPIEERLYIGSEAASQLASAAETTVILPGIGGATYSNYFLDLQPLIDSDPTFDMDGFIPGITQACQEDGRTIGIPLSSSPSLIFYRPDAFISANLPLPQPGWTWDEFEQAIRALSQAQEDGAYGFVPNGEPLQLLAPLIGSTLEISQGNWDPNALSMSLEWYIKLAQEGAVPSTPGEGDWIERDQDLITSNRAVMWIDSGQNLQYWRNLLGNGVSVAPFPVSRGDYPGQFNPSIAVCASISGGVSDRQKAWEWLKFLSTRPSAHQDFFFPARLEVLDSGTTWEGLDENSQAALRFALEHAWYGSQYSESIQLAGKALETTMAGQANLNAALTEARPLRVESPPSAGLTPVAIDTPLPAAPPGDAVQISYYGSPWVHFSNLTLEAIAAEFNRLHPEIKLRVTSELPVVPGGSVHITEMAEWVDCFAWPFTPLPEWVNSFFSLDEFLSRDGPISLADFEPAALEAFQIDGSLYGLPASSLPHVIYFNAGRLAELGLDGIDMNWSSEDFLELAERAATEESYGFVPYQGDYLGFLLAVRGVNWFDPERDPVVLPLDDPQILDAVLWLKDLVGAGIIPPTFGASAASERERLVESGRTLLWNQFAFSTNASDEAVQSDYEVGIAPPPRMSGLLPAPVQSGLFISRKSEHPDACWQWLSFLTEQPNAFIGVPSRTSIANTEEWKSVFTQPHSSVDLSSVYRAAASRPAQIQRSDRYIQGWLEQAVQAVLLGEDPGLALAQAQMTASIYQSCLDAFSSPMQDQLLACAQQADPNLALP